MFTLDPVMAQSAAAAKGLPPLLILALIEQESSGNCFAWNPEPHYIYLWHVRLNRPFRALSREESASERPPLDFPCLAGDRDQEWWGQQASWGLMQIMGGVARECGFRGPYLTELCDPHVNLEYGCRHLLNLKGRYHQAHGWPGVISSYNQGAPYKDGRGRFNNQHYVDSVIKRLNGAPL